MSDPVYVDWYEGETITYFDELVEKLESKHDVTLNAGYLDTFNAIHLSDWKDVAKDWLGNLVDDLASMLEEIEDLKENEDETILVVNKQ